MTALSPAAGHMLEGNNFVSLMVLSGSTSTLMGISFILFALSMYADRNGDGSGASAALQPPTAKKG